MSFALQVTAPKDWEAFKIDIETIKRKHKQADESTAIAFARTFCHFVVKTIWKHADSKKMWKCRQLTFQTVELDFDTIKLAKELADYFFTLNIMEYAYQIGNLYTMLLPNSYRADNGIYYTPPALAERLLDLLASEGADWAKGNVLDPACGGGAFLVTVANRMLGDYRIKCLSAEKQIRHIEQHLAGIEIDRFAGWLTQVLLDILVYQETVAARRRLKPIIRTHDTIKYALKKTRKFDIIVGNPPYGRLTLDEDIRAIYSRSLYGHANLYSLFIDAALRMKKANGLIGFVTPTSFLGGKYYSNLREVLIQSAPPLAIDFVSVRSGVFDQVLQETCLVTFGRNSAKIVTTNKINVESSCYTVERIGSFKIEKGTKPWLIAREPAEADIVNAVKKIKTTIKDYGYKVSTGQLVWNRHTEQLRSKFEDGVKPVIWAEAVMSDGTFSFDYRYRNDKQFIKLREKQDFLVSKNSLVLIQRTTAKEQDRRLIACVLPQSFADEWGGVVVENHVNIAFAITDKPKLTPTALSLVLNTKAVDRVFRCMSGSVAVSASELHAIPLPPAKKLVEIERLIATGVNGVALSNSVEKIVTKAYGLEE